MRVHRSIDHLLAAPPGPPTTGNHDSVTGIIASVVLAILFITYLWWRTRR